MQRHFAYRNQNSSELALPRAVFLYQSNNPTDMYDRSLSASLTETAGERMDYLAVKLSLARVVLSSQQIHNIQAQKNCSTYGNLSVPIISVVNFNSDRLKFK